MNVVLFNNDEAGQSENAEDLRRRLERHGHCILAIHDKQDNAGTRIDEAADLAVVSGGDGTVAWAARELHGRRIPLTVLPMGTANNVARSLGLCRPIDDLIAGWPEARIQPFDLGLVSGPWGQRRFVEGVGGGLVARSIRRAFKRGDSDRGERSDRIERALITHLGMLADLMPRWWTIRLDGTTETGDFLFVEVLNIRAIGPNLIFSPDISSSDGLLSVVTATEDDRDVLRHYLEDRLKGRDARLAFPVRTASRVKLQCDDHFHVDDEVFKHGAESAVSIDIEPAALTVLIPPPP